MSPAVERLLAAVSPALFRAEVERTRPDLLPAMQRWGDRWEAYARELGLACPAALIELGDAMDAVYIHVDDGQHSWDLLAPPNAREHRRLLGELARQFPELVARAQMLPVFGQDGDLFLLASDGRIHAFTHDDWENDGVVADSFDGLLERLARR